ncbi:MAG: thiamine ABC transporter substrate-binding protein [Candidatus Cloacimonetes bacterium]|nr:thiamine ABC transporter substrate-binding protein [Candidatus Cloacimonadota bacterium]
MNRVLILLLIAVALLSACRRETRHHLTKGYDLVIYTTGTWSDGFLREAIPTFEAEHACRVYVEPFANIARLRRHLLSEREHPVADVIVGLDNSWSQIVLADSVLSPYRPQAFGAVPQRYIYDASWRQTPLCWAWLAFIYDSRSVPQPPQTMAQMTISNPLTPYIIVHPDSTTIGRALFDWTSGYFGYSGFDKFWQGMRGNVLTIESDWEKAYHRFLAGEASYVPGHATRPCYHEMSEASDRYRAFIPVEGGYRHIEALGIVRDCRHRALAENFVNFCLRADVQALLPTSQWTLPVRDGVGVPQCFDDAPTSEKDFGEPEPQQEVQRFLDRLWREWREAME